MQRGFGGGRGAVSKGIEDRFEIDGSVLSAAQQGDRRALSVIVEVYDGRLRHLAHHLLRSPDSVDDVMQDVYVRVLGSLRTFRRASTLGSWLYRVTYNTCLSELRRRRHGIVEALCLASSAREADPAEQVLDRSTLKALLHSLPPDQRAAVLLVDAYDLGYRRASEILDCPMSTVASRVKVARARLRVALRPNDAARQVPSLGQR